MVRGPRRKGGPTAGSAGPAVVTRSMERKMEKVLRNAHGGLAGQSIIEMLEEQLTEVCKQYLVARESWQISYYPSDYYPATVLEGERTLREARGRIRGVAISVALMRHPLRRYEQAWWDYVKKLEKRHLKIARDAE
jgi:hypothetical protein